MSTSTPTPPRPGTKPLLLRALRGVKRKSPAPRVSQAVVESLRENWLMDSDPELEVARYSAMRWNTPLSGAHVVRSPVGR